MNSITPKNVQEIADQLDCGFRAFIHKLTGQLIFIPDNNNYPGMDLNAWDEELKQLESNFLHYCEIEKWTSSEAFEMMGEFAEQITDNNLQNQLFDALRKNKPFRQFKFVIDNSGHFRQHWFDFKNKWQQDFVKRQLNRLKSTGL